MFIPQPNSVRGYFSLVGKNQFDLLLCKSKILKKKNLNSTFLTVCDIYITLLHDGGQQDPVVEASDGNPEGGLASTNPI